MSWSKRKIGALGRVVTGKTPPTSRSDLFDGDLLFVTPSDLDFAHYYCCSTERTVSSEVKVLFKNQFIPRDAVMFTCIGNTIGKIAIAASESLTNQQINSLIVNQHNNPKFVYYQLLNNVRRIRGLGESSATPIINKSEFEQIDILVPRQLDEQNKIATELGRFDDLILNNRRRITLLEEATRQLYQEWFVRLRFPGHETTKFVDGVPEGWERGTVGDLATLQNGFAFKSSDWQTDGTPVIKIGNITSLGVNVTQCDCVSDYIADVASRFEIKPGELLIAMTGATVGKVGIMPLTETRHLLNQRVGAFKPRGNINSIPFLFTFFNSLEGKNQITNFAGGAAQPNISGAQIEAIKILRPSVEILTKYSSICEDLFRQRLLLERQNELARQSRDLLLPRLMSGEITL